MNPKSGDHPTPPGPVAGPGVLYLVATPIGNLEDITFRAVRVLQQADLIACEDTRHSRALLDRYQIRRPTLSYHRLNEAERAAGLIERLRAGAGVALITDAGAPVLSDPGARLVARALEAGIPVVPIPGPSAAITALMAAGIEEPVTLLGFLPARSGERRRLLQQWAAVPGSLLMFETPHRIAAALADMEDLLGPARTLVCAREMTKLHEEFLRGTIAEVRARIDAVVPRGEFTLVLGPVPRRSPSAPGAESAPAPELDPDMSMADLKRLARESGLGRRELYRRLQQLRGKIKS